MKLFSILLFLGLIPLSAFAKGQPPHCETLSKAKNVYGLSLPAGTELCRQQGDREWTWAALPKAALVFPGIPLQTGAEGKIHFSKIAGYGQLLLVNGTLGEDAVIGGIPFRKGPVEFYKKFAEPVFYPLRGTLAKAISSQGVDLPPGARLEWSGEPSRLERLRLATLAAPTVIQGRKIQNGLYFHRDGSVEEITLAEPTRIDGVPCYGTPNEAENSGSLLRVSFYPSGKLKSCVLGDRFPALGLNFPPRSRVDFYDGGALRSFLLPNDSPLDAVTVGGIPCNRTSHGFHKSMVPEPMVAAMESETDGLTTQFDVLLHRNGAVAFCDLVDDAVLAGYPLSDHASGFVGVYFYESGKLRRGHLAKEMTISKIRVPAGTGIELYESGALKAIEDHEGLTIAGVSYPRDKLIQFREDGSVLP